MPSKHSIVAVLLIGVYLGALALYVGLGGQKAQPGENAQSGSVETFSLIGGENKHLVIGETEILLRLETTWVGPMARVTYFIDNENTTKELNVGDIVLELPGGKIVLESASDFVEYATFKVSGNFQILKELSFETISLDYYGTHENHEYLVTENSTHTVISVFMGARSSGGFGISIERITQVENEIIVSVKETYPGRTATTLAVTHPEHIIKLERVQKPIVFEAQQFLVHAYDENMNPYDEIMYELVGEYRVEPGSGPPEPVYKLGAQ